MTTTALPRIPLATYRLQFNARFTFRDAQAILDYLSQLGISDLYASSYLTATPGSTHGYDVADPTRLNPEIGTDEEYWAWIHAMQARGMGHVLDLVPNHMGIARSANPWWMDVLENGPASRYASFFDITWRPLKDELADKVLIPTLGDQYGVVLDRRDLTLDYKDGAFVVRYYDDWFPVAPDTFGRVLEPALQSWLASGAVAADDPDADELSSIVNAASHLPSRASGITADEVSTRTREKEVLKRRLDQLVGRRPDLHDHIRQVITTFNGNVDDPRSFDQLDALLGEQSYRLAHWRTASEEINYRRFFDVNQLAALRMEDPAVFADVHRFVFDLVDKGAATGLRVDHVDGLFAPGDYLRRLQARAAEGRQMPADGKPLYVVVEKILGADERLLRHWPVHGTTGYEFATTVNGLFVDRANERLLTTLYDRFTGVRRGVSFEELAYACKKRVMHETMSGDINSLGYQLNRFSERNRHFRDFTLYALISTIKEVIACFPVYRTYITDSGPLTEHDRRYVERAVALARRTSPALNDLVFDFLTHILLDEWDDQNEEERIERHRFVGKFQQITSPVAAKGIEDTALYVYNRLVSLNEVGGDPTVFGVDPAHVHRWMIERQQLWPAALSATATHDTKRGEDVRARIDVLAELPSEWKAAVRTWRALNRRLKPVVNGRTAPDANEEYFLYQTLVGAWPLTPDEEPAFRERIEQYLVKAMREAKVNTSWLSPDEAHEQAVIGFVRRILDPGRPFLARFRPFQRRVSSIGIMNSLAQLLIKITAPGVPDFYQGSELWDFSMVDPDNRRPIDYERRRSILADLPAPGIDASRALFESRNDGRVKLFVMRHALAVRAAIRPVFDRGSYVPLDIVGTHADRLFAFLRRDGDAVAVTCVPRLVGALVDMASGTLPPDAWRDTALVLPADLAGTVLTNAFTGEEVVAGEDPGGPRVPLMTLLAHLPVALLWSRGARV